MKKTNNTALIVVVAVLALLVFFGGFGMMGYGSMMHGGYGSSYLCSNVGGIWCYWPNWMFLFMSVFMILIVVALVLFIVWLVKQIQKS